MVNFPEAVKVAVAKYPKTTNKIIKYGTAGFRSKADELDFILYRMGVLAGLRSCDTKVAIGVMITASHNPLPDNGVKLVDPMGEMLAPAWESHATTLVNATDTEIENVLIKIVDDARINTDHKPFIFVGRDTRPSSNRLRDAVVAGVTAIGGEVKDLGVISTPILHYVVTCHNDGGVYGIPTEDGYYKKICDAFVNLRLSGTSRGNYEPSIYYDGANGVGSIMMSNFMKRLEGSLTATLYNKDGVLNHLCGADYVKVQQKWPEGVPRTQNKRCVSVDGDADRIIYSYLVNDEFRMLDGDKIATLIAGFFQELLQNSGLSLKLGLVQTAYANGASTEYITKKLGVPVACAKTGVKHLHHMALQFDIGVYFEANGHGTVIFSQSARDAIQAAAAKGKNESAEKLSKVLDVINETVGDAISDMLLVETILHAKGWSVADWNAAYTDLPNRQMKVMVADRAVITTTDAERVCVTPEGLQKIIDEIVKGYVKGRSFVRPSGTEDIVRIYAEASTQSEADELAVKVAGAVYDHASGVGEKPTCV